MSSWVSGWWRGVCEDETRCAGQVHESLILRTARSCDSLGPPAPRGPGCWMQKGGLYDIKPRQLIPLPQQPLLHRFTLGTGKRWFWDFLLSLSKKALWFRKLFVNYGRKVLTVPSRLSPGMHKESVVKRMLHSEGLVPQPLDLEQNHLNSQGLGFSYL